MGLKKISKWIAENGIDFTKDNAEGLRQSYFFNYFSLLAITVLIVFGWENLLSGRAVTVGWIELFMAITLIINQIVVRWTKQILIASNVLLATTFILLQILIVSGGIETTGIFWQFAWLPAAFFLTGKKGGWLWLLSLIVSMLLFQIMNWLGIINLPYSLLQMRQMSVILIVASTMIYLFERSRHSEEKLAKERERELHLSQQQLKESETRLKNELAEHQKVEDQLRERSKELEAVNGLMIGRELRMRELKQELKMLKGGGDNE